MIEVRSHTDKGKREINEDAIDSWESEGRRVYMLADGLGGHGMGDVASRLVTSKIKELLIDQPDGELGELIVITQNELLAEQEKQGAQSQMKTTLVCLEIDNEQRARYWHIGDSRGYWFRGNKVVRRTLDHSVPQMLVHNGEIKEKEIRHHVDRNRLLRVMGAPWSTPKYEVSDWITIGKKDTFLLCSDGFWELIDEKTMSRYLKVSKHPKEWIDEMKKEVLKNGKDTSMDNYSVIAVFVR